MFSDIVRFVFEFPPYAVKPSRILGFQRLRAEELQHDELVADLMDQNAELQAEADSLRIELTETRSGPTQVGAPRAGGIGPAARWCHAVCCCSSSAGNAWMWTLSLPNPYQIPQELAGILADLRHSTSFNSSDPPNEAKDPAPEVEQKTSEAPKPGEVSDLLAKAGPRDYWVVGEDKGQGRLCSDSSEVQAQPLCPSTRSLPCTLLEVGGQCRVGISRIRKPCGLARPRFTSSLRT